VKVLGVSLDGYGYGEDGTAWGAEFLLSDYDGYERLGHFKYVPLPGGDLAAKQPWRMALAYLYETFMGMSDDRIVDWNSRRITERRQEAGIEHGDIWRRRAKETLLARIDELERLKRVSPKKRNAVIEMIERSINSPMASSCGRLFDAVSFLVGLAPMEMEFEAEAPMRLESSADDTTRSSYRFKIIDDKKRGQATFYRGNKKSSLSPFFQISFNPTIKGILNDLNKGILPSQISAKFHNTLARTILKAAERVRQEQKINAVVLTGGVFLNKRLLTTTLRLLNQKGFKTVRPILYSPNDESISVGQIAYALNILQKQKK
jgi:hydrogenase maturation protein HypF